MIPALAPLFLGGFAHYGERLRLAQPDDPALPLTALLDPAVLDVQLQAFRSNFAQEDPRAVLSIWSKYYFLYLVPPVLAANLILQRDLPLDPHAMRVEMDPTGLPAVFVFADEGGPLAPPLYGLDRFASLLQDNLAFMIDGWQQRYGLSGKVLWSNASRYLRWFVQELSRFGLPEPMWAPGKSLLEAKAYADGTRNPLYQAYVERFRRDDGEPLSVRKLCCIRYLLPDTELCEDCPRLCHS